MTESLLSTYRVLDLTNEKGFLCGKALGDLGAEVIKIEPPGGDPARKIGPFYKDVPDPEKSLYWFAFNTSKKGITLDIEKEEGREIFKQLVKRADLVIESYPPGYMEKQGLSYSALEELNPGIVLTSITPFGQTGPYRDFKGADIVLWGMGSMLYLSGDTDRPPTQVSVPQAYSHGGLHGAMASMFALYHRELTGEGQWVDVSIQEAVIWTVIAAPEALDVSNEIMTRTGPNLITKRPAALGELRCRLIWPCKDGYVSLFFWGGVLVGFVKATKALVEMMDKEGMAGDLKDYDWSKYDASTMTQQERDALEEPIAKFILTKTKAELYQATIEKGIICAPLNTIKDLTESLQFAARDFWVGVEHPELGATLTYPGDPVKLGQASWRPRSRAPLIGEHNQEIYEKELGLSKEQLLSLKQTSVI